MSYKVQEVRDVFYCDFKPRSLSNPRICKRACLQPGIFAFVQSHEQVCVCAPTTYAEPERNECSCLYTRMHAHYYTKHPKEMRVTKSISQLICVYSVLSFSSEPIERPFQLFNRVVLDYDTLNLFPTVMMACRN